MKRKEKTAIRLEYATRAVIEALEAFNNKNPGDCITKKELLPHVENRCTWIMDGADDDRLDLYTIGYPTKNFIYNNWTNICFQAANHHRKYIVWEPRHGVRLGTFKEYQEINKILGDIARGIEGNATDRAKIVHKQGGKTIIFRVDIKLLESGNDDELEAAPVPT